MRLDQLLFERGFFPSRERAKRAVMAGLVEVDGRRIDKAGTAVPEACEIGVTGGEEPFVSRAGRKLDHALEVFALSVDGHACLDVGASTGGFTHCLLERGAARVYAIDVGYGQLDLRLRNDPRVVVMERTNARHVTADAFDQPMMTVVVDVSFISLLKVLPAVLPHLAPGGQLITLIKPQFEAGREHIAKGGVVRDESIRQSVIAERAQGIIDLGVELLGGLEPLGVVDSPIAGARSGNLEALAAFRRPVEQEAADA